MFAKAIQNVEPYTMPVVISAKLFDGSIQSGCGTFIVLNKEGWILTAAHIVQQLNLFQQHQKELVEYQKARTEIVNNSNLRRKLRENQLRNLRSNPHWITNQAIMWGWPKAVIRRFETNLNCDLAAGKLEPFDEAWVNTYPIFKNPKEPMQIGSSLCRLGYPLYEISATFDNGSFSLAPGVLPIPRFPNDGIFTRNINMISTDKSRTSKFLETSTAGLRGQSGGPIFDTEGHIWALQSCTQSIPLGFAPVVSDGKNKIVEHQFMHVGWGVHVEEIIAFLTSNGIAFKLSS